LSLISENTASGFYYGVDRADDDDMYGVIYNLGNWDLEVSVLKYSPVLKELSNN